MPVCRPWLIPVAIVLIFQFAAIQGAQAQELGEYHADGLTLILGSEKARIIYMGKRCVGDFTGRVVKHSDRITLSDPNTELAPECVVTLREVDPGTVVIEQGQGCTAYHGAACSISGTVHRIQPNGDL